MIFVILGTEQFAFDRFIKALDRLVEDGVLTDEVFVQLGSCKYEPKHVGFKRFMPFDEMCDNIKKASLVLAHAGAGTTLLSLQLGKAPILFPRLSKHKEHVDDHQVTFAEKMKENGYVQVAYNDEQLKDAILKVKTLSIKSPKSRREELVKFLKDIV